MRFAIEFDRIRLIAFLSRGKCHHRKLRNIRSRVSLDEFRVVRTRVSQKMFQRVDANCDDREGARLMQSEIRARALVP